MAEKTRVKVIIGVALIGASFLCGTAILYMMGQKIQRDKKKVASLEVQLANLMAERAPQEVNPLDRKRIERGPIVLEEILSRAERIYGPEEKMRREGIFWVDRKASQYMVNLGVVNGLRRGSSLGIYDGGKKIGDATVEMVLDIISYVKPVDKTLDDFANDYYRVVIIQ